MTTRWVDRYAERTQRMQSSAIRELLKLTQQPDVISFAGGLPAPELFPSERIQQATEKVLREVSHEALQYGTTEGYLPLREMIVRHMRRYNIYCNVENVLITAGSQQALDLIGKIMVDPGDKIVVEDPTYLGALQAWNAYGAEYITVPTDDEGMRTDALEQVLADEDIKFIYALPNFQNPSGRTLSGRRRKELAALSERFEVPIIEDDPYGQLRYEGQHEMPLFVTDALNRHEDYTEGFFSGNVIYLSTFSKTLCPGFRVAWIVGPEDVIAKLVQAKQGTDLHTGTFAQIVAYETARGGFLDQHILALRQVYRERRDLMLSLMEQYFPPGVSWTRPEGGLFTWVTLPESIDAAELLKKAIERKVAFVPGAPFFPGGGGHNTMRVNFSNSTPEQITEGIKRLAEVITEELTTVAVV